MAGFADCIARVCDFDKKVDLMEVDQFGFLNLREAYDKGVVPGTVSITDESFNGMLADDVINRPKDIFERYRQGEYVKSALKAAQAKTEQSPEGAN